jgi:imidazolonepropionase
MTDDRGPGSESHHEPADDLARDEPGTDEPGTLVLTNVGHLVTNDPERGSLCGGVDDAAVICIDGVVTWVGNAAELPTDLPSAPVDVEGRSVLPGFVDAHTHLTYSGDRLGDFVQRMEGVPYADILAAGGGIYSTVAATRESSLVELIADTMARLERMQATGTTTIEIKSGYGLDAETEFGLISTARALDMALPIDIVSTFLGAHVVGPEFRDDPAGYLELVNGPILDLVAEHVEFVDVFCDPVAFDVTQARSVAEAAAGHGLGVRIHADQTGRIGAAALAAEVGAASADHLDHSTDEDLSAMAESGTTAVLVPGASYSMRVPYPDGRRIWDSGVTVAIATDHNPGTSPVETMPFVISLAVSGLGLTPDEALWAATRGGALSLRREDRGAIAPGMVADFAIVNGAPADLAYRPDRPLVSNVIKAGTVVA